MPGPVLQGQLTLDDKEFINGLNRSTDLARSKFAAIGGHADGLANKLTDTLGKKFEGLFKRDPAHRAAAAFGELAKSITGGDAIGGVEEFSRRLGGIGLAASIGIGVAAPLIAKVAEQILEADKAADALNLQLSKPTNIQAALGVEGITAELQKDVALTDTLIEKQKTFGARLEQGFQKAGIGGALKAFFTGGRLGGGAEEDIKAGLQGQLEAQKNIAAAEGLALDIREKGLSVSEEDSAIQKISVDAAAKRAAIQNQTLDAQNKITAQLKEDAERRKIGLTGFNPAEIKALEDARARLGEHDAERLAIVDKAAALETEGARQEFGIKSRSVAVEQDLANMSLQLRSSEEIKEATLKSQLGLIEDQLNFDTQLTREKRSQLLVDKTRAQTAIKNLTAERFFQPGKFEAIDVGAAQERERQKIIPEGFTPRYPGDVPTRDISGKLIPSPAYKTSPEAYGQTGEPSEPRGHPYKSELDQFTKHMALPGHMERFEGTGEFESRFGGLKPSPTDFSEDTRVMQEQGQRALEAQQDALLPAGLGVAPEELGPMAAAPEKPAEAGFRPKDLWTELRKQVPPDFMQDTGIEDVIQKFASPGIAPASAPTESTGAELIGAGEMPARQLPPPSFTPPPPQEIALPKEPAGQGTADLAPAAGKLSSAGDKLSAAADKLSGAKPAMPPDIGKPAPPIPPGMVFPPPEAVANQNRFVSGEDDSGIPNDPLRKFFGGGLPTPTPSPTPIPAPNLASFNLPVPTPAPTQNLAALTDSIAPADPASTPTPPASFKTPTPDQMQPMQSLDYVINPKSPNLSTPYNQTLAIPPRSAPQGGGQQPLTEAAMRNIMHEFWG
jgi:hypothetical protein